ncbi:MAG: carboxypeptidase regulatory-like domain-containing protein [Paludibacteraceae bacterium]|nr:carboxypeptidase regulatory-like domain-containing protein [Paludibacteraceae bacterium]
MKKFFYLICLYSIILGFAACDKEKVPEKELGSIYGCVTDFATGEPVQNANVQLRPSGETTLTGYDGMYEFLDIQDGNYSITVSKAEYTDLIDDYVISVKNGRRMRRDVQIEKIPTYIRFTDMMGKDISTLDFGDNSSVNMLSFNIYNNGTVKINCQVVESCDWITSVSPGSCSINPGQNTMISVQIDRAKLASGENVTKLYITSNNGSNVINVRAISSSGNPPSVQISPAEVLSETSVKCTGQVLDNNGGTISDCGFCYSKTTQPTISDQVAKLGPKSGTFSYTITNLQSGTTYYIRAYATSNLGTGYSSVVSVSTTTGLPTCGETSITNLDPTTARGQSSAYSSGSGRITEKGFCWSASHTPTINDSKVSCGSGDGAISGYLSSLQPSTTYRVRSYAKSEYGTAYGEELIFTSLSGLATVTTSSARLSGDEIITGGTVKDNAGTVVIDRGVCYGASQNPNLSWNFEHTYDGDGTGSFTSRIPKPSNRGYIYIRAYATTKYGTSYGDQVSLYVQ